MYGCEFLVMDKTTYTEYCAINGEDTNGAVMCDFEYERCPLRAEAQSHKREQQNAQASGELIQTSIFGKSGEKPFKVK
ncbi:MAG: hypothetical protein ACI4MB_05730 [Candidatus Coproplasma sp.]